MPGVKLTGAASYLPERVLGNEELARTMAEDGEAIRVALDLSKDNPRLDQFRTSDAWIQEHTRVRERRIVEPGEATSDLAARAGRAALEVARLDHERVEALIVARVSPDHLYSPSTSARTHHLLGLSERVLIHDVENACSSYIDALFDAYGLIRSGLVSNVLLIGADVMSGTVDKRRLFRPLVGDGAGAFVLEATTEEDDWFGSRNFDWGCDSSGADLICAPAGGSRRPLVAADFMTSFAEPHKLQMNGNAVARRVNALLPGKIELALKKAGVALSEIGCIILHQMNGVIIEVVTAELRGRGFRGTVPITIDRWGNTTSASLPTTYDYAVKNGLIRKGMLVLFFAVGGGFAWGSAVMRQGSF